MDGLGEGWEIARRRDSDGVVVVMGHTFVALVEVYDDVVAIALSQ